MNVIRAIAIVAVSALAVIGVGQVASVTAAGGQDAVYVAVGDNFPDALGAGPVAALNNAPLLLVQKDAIPSPTLAELNRLMPSTIYIIGGTGVISDTVKTALEGLSFSPTVVRLAGADRFATAAEVSASHFPADLDADTLNGRSSSDFLDSTIKTRRVDGTVADGGQLSIEASCLLGERIIGGGASISAFADDVPIISSRPGLASGALPNNGDAFTTWRATAINPAGGTGAVDLRVFAICSGDPFVITLDEDE